MNIEAVKERLLQQKETLTARINAIEVDLRKIRSADFAEQTTETENDQVLEEIANEAKLEVKQINATLQKIERNEYGICSVCEQPIAPERLLALPHTNTCIHCAD